MGRSSAVTGGTVDAGVAGQPDPDPGSGPRPGASEVVGPSNLPSSATIPAGASGAARRAAGTRLSFWEATFLMVGAGVGAGIMAVPYLAERAGLPALLAILGVAVAANWLIHLMLAEVCFRTGRDLQVIELMGLYVFRGRAGAVLLWVVFAMLTVAFVANLAAYIAGEGEILTSLTGLSPRLAEVAAYVASAGVVFFGLKAVGVFEEFGALGMFAFVAVLAVGAAGVPFAIDAVLPSDPRETLALYGMTMYALYTFYSVPQVVQGLAPDRRLAARAVVLGLSLNGLLVLIVAVVALGVSPTVTTVAIIGIADGIGSWAGVVGQLFILVALVTSYWSVSLALADILRQRTGLRPNVSWLLATLPSLLLLSLGAAGFLEYLRVAAGATAIVVVLILIPMYRNARREGDVVDPGWTLGRWGTAPVLAAVFAAALLMAAGSLLEI